MTALHAGDIGEFGGLRKEAARGWRDAGRSEKSFCNAQGRVSAHLNLRVFHRAVEMAVNIDMYGSKVPRRRPDLQDQARRSSASVALDIAEGTSETRRSEKARFYRMARRSAKKTDGALILIERIFGGTTEREALRNGSRQISAMPTAISERTRRHGTRRVESESRANAPRPPHHPRHPATSLTPAQARHRARAAGRGASRCRLLRGARAPPSRGG